MKPSDTPLSSDKMAMQGESRTVRLRLWGWFIATMVLGVIGFVIGFPELLGGVKVINESDIGGLDDSIAAMEGALFWVIPLGNRKFDWARFHSEKCHAVFGPSCCSQRFPTISPFEWLIATPFEDAVGLIVLGFDSVVGGDQVPGKIICQSIEGP